MKLIIEKNSTIILLMSQKNFLITMMTGEKIGFKEEEIKKI